MLKLITDKLMTDIELRPPKTKNTTELCSIFSITVSIQSSSKLNNSSNYDY